MDNRRNQPIGIELVKRGIATEDDINKALEYQRTHPNKRIGDLLNELGLCEPRKLINAIGEIIGEKAIYLTATDIKIDITNYISLDIARKNNAVPFDVDTGKIKVCFAETTNKRTVDQMRLLFLNKGLVMEKYISFESNILNIINSLEGVASDNIDVNADISGLIDSIIKTGMEKRASDIHIEPEESTVRIRYRIDGELVTAATIEKEKQQQLIGRLKAISNMHQEKQESQDGRILMYPDYNIRVSSQKNVYGEKFVLRLLKKNADVQQIFELGFPNDPELVKRSFNKKNSIVLIAAPTGEGKTTTLYSIIDFLNRPEINITTIEDPVEIRIPGLNQIEIDTKTSFSDSLRTVLRQDPDIILVGEIRDKETAEIAMQAGQTGHYVLSTIHTIDSVEVITRLRKIGVTNYDIASTLATSVSQRLVRKVCKDCAREREFTQEEKDIINGIAKKYGVEYDFTGKHTYDAVGCEKCNNSGYYGRIGMFEVLNITDQIKELIMNDHSSIEIRKEAINEGYKPLIIDGFNKIMEGYTTLKELNSKLILY
jgi:type IV pilus assembly protein PilB